MINTYKEDFKLVNSMALPIVLTYFLQLFFELGDQAIIGRTSVSGFAAAGVVASFIYVLTGTLGMISVAYNISCSRSIGENNLDYSHKLFNTSVCLCILFGAVFEIACLLLGKYFLMKFYGLTGEMLSIASSYLYVSAIGLTINMLLFIFSAFFKSIQNTKIFFYSSLVASIVNLFFDYTLVFGKFGFPKLGVTGAALGTILGLFSSLLVDIYVYNKYNPCTFRINIDKTALKELIKLFVPLSAQDFLESSLFLLIITSIISRLGAYNMATYNILTSLTNFLLFPVYAYAGTALTLVSRANGEKNHVGLTRYPIISMLSSFGFAIFFGTIMLLFPSLASNIITNDSQVIYSATNLVVYAIIIQAFNLVHQIYKYALQGLEYEKWVLYYSTIISLIALPLIYFLSTYLKLELSGVYLGLGINYIVLAFGYVLKYSKCKYKLEQTIEVS